MACSTPGFPVFHHIPEFAQTHVHLEDGVIQTSHPLSSPSPPFFSLQSFPASGSFQMSQFFAQVAKILEYQLQHQSFQLIFRTDSFRIDWLDLLAVQGTLRSLHQHHSSQASILWLSACFIVQFSHPYMTTGKTIALTRWTFVGKVVSWNKLDME